jgi:hypothetical protein
MINKTIDFVLPKDIQKEGEIKRIQAYKKSEFKRACFIFFNVITIGFTYLIARWYLAFWLYMNTSESDT